ncbi:hypothetical protein [Leifsonia shinshuensis]|uniref:hypothetical protein n=1 Tax=Leifsonia shinshuensis TaxID=150026 RepID=UPI00285C8867|nr:hypothetical protein [Leifsonia shinshuensis]MDR6973023.1 CDP-diglyceride synthetase [Leifsonia shinshuensis]
MTEPQNTTPYPTESLTDATTPLAPPPAPFPPAATAVSAPIRWGGVVWGALLTVFAALTLWIVSSSERAAETANWISALTPGSAWALGAAVVGLIIVVSALLGGLRASQRRRLTGRG